MKITSSWLPILLIIFGALLSVLGTTIAMHQQTLSERKLREKTEEIAGNVTSGDSHPSAMITCPSGNKNVLDLMIRSNGKYPLYDVQVRIVDGNKMRQVIAENESAGHKALSMNDLPRFESYLNVGTLGPSKAVANLPPLAKFTDETKSFSFSFFFNHRFGSVTQVIEGQRRKDGTWARYEKLTRGNELLMEKKDVDFKDEKSK